MVAVVCVVKHGTQCVVAACVVVGVVSHTEATCVSIVYVVDDRMSLDANHTIVRAAGQCGGHARSKRR